jgi:hypothetical protein
MDTATPRAPRSSVAVVIGWILTVPGFLMLAGVVAHGVGLLGLAGCEINIVTANASCPPGPFGNAMSVLQFFALVTYVSVVMLVGLVPIAWSVLYPVVRWQRRRGGAPEA